MSTANPISAPIRFVMLGGFSRYASMVFVARPEVKGVQDLKGKIIGIQRPGDAYEKSARFALRHLGLDVDKDVQMLALGTKDREALEESWQYAAKMPAKPYAVESAVQAVLDHLAEAQPRFAQHRPAEFIDARILTELDKDGYIDKLYGGQAK